MKKVYISLVLIFLGLVIVYLFLTVTSDTARSHANQESSAVTIPSTATSTITILISGDIMLDRYVRASGEKNGYDSLFDGVRGLFHSADIAVANLEGPITSYPSKTFLKNGSFTKSFTFTFAPSSTPALLGAGITLVSLANNHTDNFGRDGVMQTHSYLNDNGIDWFGDPANISGTEKIICKNTICIAFVGYHEFELGFENIVNDVSRLAHEGYPVIVMPHWGDEYASTSPERVKEMAHKLIAAGAFVIVGSHPHVIEDREWIDGVPVIYSLGNLLFDQYFSKEVLLGNVAELTISENGTYAHIDRVRLYTVSNALKKGPRLTGVPIEFQRP
ncbi:MAG TPA: CapA family protein [Candidatus Paceibacterota bacterium]|jgi:poly-gamma-glutamate synthesis protein (capsule biosynthesis protein)|nr:CapA family protein [Candidatus Paceibacterota bacterium]